MTPPVYSLRIFSGDISPASGTVGPLVPAGLIYVLRDIDVVYRSSTAGDSMVVFNPTLGLLVAYEYDPPPPVSVYQWRGRQVYNVGERVGFRSFGGTWSVCASGYMLSLP